MRDRQTRTNSCSARRRRCCSRRLTFARFRIRVIGQAITPAVVIGPRHFHHRQSSIDNQCADHARVTRDPLCTVVHLRSRGAQPDHQDGGHASRRRPSLHQVSAMRGQLSLRGR